MPRTRNAGRRHVRCACLCHFRDWYRFTEHRNITVASMHRWFEAAVLCIPAADNQTVSTLYLRMDVGWSKSSHSVAEQIPCHAVVCQCTRYDHGSICSVHRQLWAAVCVYQHKAILRSIYKHQALTQQLSMFAGQVLSYP